MTRPVSIVIPSLNDPELFELNLPPLLAEVERRSAGDEVLVVDDTGDAVLAAGLAKSFPSVRVVAQAQNSGFAAALLAGVEAARHEFVFCMNPDVRVHAGFLAPLVEHLSDPEVHSVTPRVLLNGDRETIESVMGIRMENGLAYVDQPGLEPGLASQFEAGELPVAYAVGGTCLLRKSEFVAQGGFDPLYEPFYLEDTDLGWGAWRAGQRVVYEAQSVVEHHHRGTIGKRVPRPFVVATTERNRILFQWKFLDDEVALREHVAALYRMAVDAYLSDRRDELVWLCLALDRQELAFASRAGLPQAARTYAEIRSATDARRA